VALQNLSEVWHRASLMQRLLLLAIVLACVGGGFLLVNWARQPSLALLYSGLAPEEAASIMEKVRDSGLPYQLKQGGTAIYVPEEKVYSLRLTMASAGLPAGDNRGYQILDQESLGASPFNERVRYNRAIEGEIARSIQTLDAVASARVHVVRPEAAIFRKGDKAASATVVVKLRGGHQLSGANVAAIVYLVSGAVEDLAPEKVVVVDAHGTLLSGESADRMNGRMASLLEQKRQMEDYLARKAERQLAMVLGPNRATVQVAVEMDTTAVESETKRYGPDKGMPSKESIKESRSTEPAREKDGTGGTTTDTTTETEYKLTETVERKTELAGEVKSRTVSVIVDLSAPAVGGEAAAAGKKLAIKDVEEIVKTALGLRIDAAAGATGAAGPTGAAGATGTGATDRLTVKEASFYQPPEASAAATPAEPMFTKEFMLEIAKQASLGLLVLGALLALKMFRGPRRKLDVEGMPLAALAGGGGQVPAGMLSAGAEANPELLKAQITKALQDNPEEVKRLFLSWVDNEKGEV
jgi:flagellar M-ring protein FliF